MKLGLIAEFDPKGTSGEEVCLEDPALSSRKWIVGDIQIYVSHSGYDIEGRGAGKKGMMPDSKPEVVIHGYVSFQTGPKTAAVPELLAAIAEAEEYARTMHARIKQHIARLVKEEAGKEWA